MKPVLVVVTLVVLILWSLFQVVEKVFPQVSEDHAKEQLTEVAPGISDTQMVLRVVLQDTSGRNPFHSPFRPLKKKAVVRRSAPVKEELPRPNISINAIMPGPVPVVIFNHQNSTKLIRPGQTIQGWTLKTVNHNTVTLSRENQTIEMSKGSP